MNAVMRAPAHLSYTANLHTKILDFGGFDSSRILILKGAIRMSKEHSPEILSQAILVGIFLVGRLGVKGVSRTFDASDCRLELPGREVGRMPYLPTTMIPTKIP